MENKKGFTLLEILLVIGIIAILAVVVAVSLNPAKRMEDAQNSRRLSDIQNILSAVQQYIVDNRGAIPAGISDTEVQLGLSDSSCEIFTDICNVGASACTNLLNDSAMGKYLKSMPYDTTGSSQTSHYSIQMNSDRVITVRACDSTDPATSEVSQ